MQKVFFTTYSSILFNQNYYIGIGLFLLSFLNYHLAITGIVSVLSIFLFIKFFKLNEAKLFQAYYLYNSLLVSMGIGYLFTPSFLSLLSVIILSISTFAISYFLNHFMHRYDMSILSLPFAIVSILSYFIISLYSNPFPLPYEHIISPELPLKFEIYSYFKALGSIFFLPNTLAGIFIFLLLLLHSPIMAMATIVGFYFGVFTHAFLFSSGYDAFHNIYNFNSIITALALYGIFLLPTLKNFLLTLIAISLTTILSYVMSNLYGYYTLTLPFSIVVNTFLLLLHFQKYKGLNHFPFKTPEESFTYYLSNQKRFAPEEIQISLPFTEKWSVLQAFNGEWTHKNNWSHAYDFVIKKNKKTYLNHGHYVEDYYCYGTSILAPVSGYVVEICNDLPDNAIGIVDEKNNWGNYIIIKSDYGYFVEISHLLPYSITAKVNDYVQVNDPVAKCGNSGYSFEPHLHIQVQKFAYIGSPTLAFTFSEFILKKQLHFHALPQLNEFVENITLKQNLAQTFSFLKNEVYTYDVYKNNKHMQTYSFTSKCSTSGETYFEDQDGNKLFFFKTTTLFYFYNYLGSSSYLQKLYALAPKIPLINKHISFNDYIPKDFFYKKRYKLISQILLSFYPSIYMKKYRYTINTNSLKSHFGTVTFSSIQKGFSNIKYQETELRIKNKHER